MKIAVNCSSGVDIGLLCMTLWISLWQGSKGDPGLSPGQAPAGEKVKNLPTRHPLSRSTAPCVSLAPRLSLHPCPSLDPCLWLPVCLSPPVFVSPSPSCFLSLPLCVSLLSPSLSFFISQCLSFQSLSYLTPLSLLWHWYLSWLCTWTGTDTSFHCITSIYHLISLSLPLLTAKHIFIFFPIMDFI